MFHMFYMFLSSRSSRQEYSKQVKANASALAEALKAKGPGAQPWWPLDEAMGHGGWGMGIVIGL